ncbi:MAG: DUF4124 domain-containing protein [Curvibacter sp. GWA2_64_110]|nr:MAG: DUF4124 domain-containing protein [Curvibacter sp. GWA2_64_110]HCY14871.1 DUF4124 domain-containing protein [Curvibacter sp.]
MGVLGDGRAQTQPPNIYSCTDGQGRPRTSDRPIAECADREQRLLNPSGTVRATVGPTLSVQERAALEQRRRQEVEVQARQAEEKQRERALLLRYPNQAAHDKERAEALAQIALVRQAADNRMAELVRQREALQAELEFYQKNPAKAPLALRRQADENTRNQAAQKRFMAEQDAERGRVNARFDAEQARLRPLWGQPSSVEMPATGQAR